MPRSVRLWHKEAPAEMTGARFEVQEGNPLAKDHPCQSYHNPGQVKLVCELYSCHPPLLRAVLPVNAVMFTVEVMAGLAAGSASLQADALDFLGDTAN